MSSTSSFLFSDNKNDSCPKCGHWITIEEFSSFRLMFGRSMKCSCPKCGHEWKK